MNSTSTERRLLIKYVRSVERSQFVGFMLATIAVTHLMYTLQIPLKLEALFLWLFHVLIDTRARQKFQTMLQSGGKLIRLTDISENSDRA